MSGITKTINTTGSIKPCFGRGRGRISIVEKVHLSKPLLEIKKEDGLSQQLANEETNDDTKVPVTGTGKKSAIDQIQRGSVGPGTGTTSKKYGNLYRENQLLTVWPIPYESNDVLEDADVKVQNEGIFGCAEDEPYSIPLMKPVLPTRIVLRNDRYFKETSGSVVLPKDIELNSRLLYIDDEDVLYLRCYEEDQPENKHKYVIKTLQKLLSCMDTFYSRFHNRRETYLGKDDWIPDVGEVVVVRVKRAFVADHSGAGLFSRSEYHRAEVKALKIDHITVELIDDYGVGGVQFSNIFRLMPQFTVLPVQVFHCELAEMGLIDHRKLVHSVVRHCAIGNIWPDCHINYVGTTWLGEKSKNGRPLVEIMIQLKSMRLDKYIPLKTHVYRNLQSVLTPFVHLVENNGYCHVLDADQLGFLWVRFDADSELYSRIRFVLSKLVPYYLNLLQYCRLTVKMIAPKDDISRFKRNMERLYVVLIPDSEMQNSKTLYRVRIKSVNPRTQTAKVYCIDDHIYHDVSVCQLFPLFNLYPDLTYIYPLILKVHLHRIKVLKTNADPVKDTLFGEQIKMTLVHEWPRNVYPPEVSIDSPFKAPDLQQPVFDKSMDADKKSTDYNLLNFTGFCKYFVDLGCAEILEADEMTLLSKLIRSQAAKQEKKETAESNRKLFSFENERRTELLACHAFMGENFSFLVDKCATFGSSMTSTRASSYKSCCE